MRRSLLKKKSGNATPYLWLLLLAVTITAYHMVFNTSCEHHVSLLNLPIIERQPYVPAAVESHVIENAVQLGYHTGGEQKGCRIWNDATTSIQSQLLAYRSDLENYTARVKAFQASFPDLRLRPSDEACRSVDLHEKGLEGIFTSGQLSWTSSSSSGYVEPLLSPMRHPMFCETRRGYLENLSYLVHDFGAMCRSLQRTSRIVLVDMGASLTFHGGRDSPALYLMDLFRRFGFPFDHIYAFELTPTEPAEVYKNLPPHWVSAYHWINVGVSVEPGNPLNPFTIIKNNFDKDDLIIVKLDIDTPNLEMALVQQLLDDDELASLVDQFYFEHHVGLRELQRQWGDDVQGTVKDSLDLFHKLRQKGVPAHFWV